MLAIRSHFCFYLISSLAWPINGYCAAEATTKVGVCETLVDVIALLGFFAIGIFIMSDPKARSSRFFRVLIVGIYLALPGCASVERTSLFGASMGAAAGLGTGILIEKSVGSALIGAGIGAALGAGVGFLAHRDRPAKETIARPNVGPNEIPPLLPPEATCQKAEERIDGAHYYGPRLECEIHKPAIWTR